MSERIASTSGGASRSAHEPTATARAIDDARAFAATARVGFTHVFAYRAEIVIQLLSAGIVAALNGSLWSVAISGRSAIAGVPSAEIFSYVIMAWVGVSVVATRVNEEIGRRMREGLIAADLLRPMTLQRFWYARDLGRAAATLLVQTLPLFLACLLAFPVRLPSHAITWVFWFCALFLAHAVNYGLSFLVGLAALPFRNVSGLTHLKSTLVSIFSGALIPLALFPSWAQGVVSVLPFAALAHAPATIFLESETRVGSVLAGQAAWAIALWLLGQFAWERAASRLTVQGG